MSRFPYFGIPYPYYRRNHPFYHPNYYNPEFYTKKTSNNIYNQKIPNPIYNNESNDSKNEKNKNCTDNTKEFSNDDENMNRKEKSHKRASLYKNKKQIFNFNALFSSNTDQAIFELFGISLYLDDIIILGLLYFLYQEEVKDDMLFLCLILLLLS